MVTIGYYKEIYRNAQESLLDHMSNTPHPHKDELLAYLNNFDACAAMPMIATDAVDEKTIIGTPCEYNDGKFRWRSQIVYYFKKYNVELPQEFIDAVIQ